MNFLKSVLGTSAFPGYSIQDRIEHNGLFLLNNATRKDDNTACSVLTFEVAKNPTLLPLARNSLTRIRSLKHPGIIQYIDSLESESHIYIATERVSPLRNNSSIERDLLVWGLYSIARTIGFINDTASVHGNIKVSSIFTTEAGEWKLGGLEFFTCLKEEEFIQKYANMIDPVPPELKNMDVAQYPTSLDAYQFGVLISTLFNGSFTTQQGKIPGNMLAQFRRLVSPNTRISVSTFIEFGRRPDLFFHNPLITVTEQIPNLPLKSKEEVERFLSENQKVFASLPRGFTRNRIFPEMVKSLESGGGVSALNAILAIAKDLPPSDHEALIAPMLLKAWTKDRSTQLVLLENLAEYDTYLSSKQINDKIFPIINQIFSDRAPIMRETAIRQILVLLPHLTDRTINGDLLKCLAKTANDPQPGIRTNTTICLGKIADSLGSSKRKVLTAAFSRSLKDPFIHARMAALQAISATSSVYEKDDIALRLLPNIVTLLIDTEINVRTTSRKCLDDLLIKLDGMTREMPDSANGAEKVETSVFSTWMPSIVSQNIESPAPSQPASVAPSIVPSRAQSPVVAQKPVPPRPTLPQQKSSKKGLVLEKKKKEVVDDWGSWDDQVAPALKKEEDWDTDAW